MQEWQQDETGLTVPSSITTVDEVARQKILADFLKQEGLPSNPMRQRFGTEPRYEVRKVAQGLVVVDTRDFPHKVVYDPSKPRS